MQKILLYVSVVLLNIFFVNIAYSLNKDSKAALAILSLQSQIEYHYQYCRTKVGEQAYKYDYIKYIWELMNSPYTKVALTVFNKLPAIDSNEIEKSWKINKMKMLSERKRQDDLRNRNYCVRYFSELIKSMGKNLITQKKNLSHLLGSAEEKRIINRNVGMEVGCMKQGFNSGIKQFERMRDACKCQNKYITGSISSQDIDKYLDLVGSKNTEAAVKFISSKINIKTLQSCYQ